jgi:hypothetical protein
MLSSKNSFSGLHRKTFNLVTRGITIAKITPFAAIDMLQKFLRKLARRLKF